MPERFSVDADIETGAERQELPAVSLPDDAAKQEDLNAKFPLTIAAVTRGRWAELCLIIPSMGSAEGEANA